MRLAPTIFAVAIATCAAVPAFAQAQPDGAGMSLQQFSQRSLAKIMAADGDGDGRVSRAEFTAVRSGKKGDPAAHFAKLDTNGDGYLDKGELETASARKFRHLDQDGNGIVTPQERAAAHARKRARPAGA